MRVDIGVIVKSTEVSAFPAEAVHAKTDVRNHQLQCENGSNCSVQVEFLHVLLRFFVSLATAAKGPLPLASGKKHLTLFPAVPARSATTVHRH